MSASYASAEWLALEIGSHDHRLTCATSGKANGGPMLVLCGANGALHEYRWADGRWTRLDHPSGFSRPASAALVDFYDDGAPRLLVGARFESQLIEHTLRPSGKWLQRTVSMPGLFTWDLKFAPGNGGSPGFLLVKRLSKWLKEPLPTCFGLSFEQYFACRIPYGRWSCETVGTACVEIGAGIPPSWDVSWDMVLGNQVLLKKKDDWVAGASLPLAINVIPSRVTPRRVYLDREVADLTADFTGVTIAPNGSNFTSSIMTARGTEMDEISGAYNSMVASLAEDPNTEIVLAADGEYLRRIAATSKSWRNERVFKLAGDVQQLISADLRGDGIERVYIIENLKNAQKGHVLELTYFPRRPRVSISPLIVKSSGSSDGESRLLSDLISRELVDSNVIQVVEEDQLEKVERERAFNAGLCVDDVCRAKFVQVRKSDYLVVPTIIRDKERTGLQITVFDSNGVARREIQTEMEPGERLLEAVMRTSKELVRAWSEFPRF